MHKRARAVGKCIRVVRVLVASVLGCSDDAARTPEDSGVEVSDAGARDSAARQESRTAAEPPKKPAADKHTDPMGVGQEEMPESTQAPVDPLDNAQFPELGATRFESAKPEFESAVVRTNSTELSSSGSSELSGVSSGDTLQRPVTAPSPGVLSPQREILEADLVQVHGDVLYVLNRYRGLVLVDMSMPETPVVLGRAPFQASPVDMYVRDGNAYIVMSDYFVYWNFDSDADPQGFHGPRVDARPSPNDEQRRR